MFQGYKTNYTISGEGKFLTETISLGDFELNNGSINVSQTNTVDAYLSKIKFSYISFNGFHLKFVDFCR